MFNEMKKAGLSVQEAAIILRVSRVAMFNWKAKRSTPHPQLQRRVESFIEFLNKLLELEKLPLKEGLDKDARREKVMRLKTAFEKFDN
jgi:hypothetical protein